MKKIPSIIIAAIAAVIFLPARSAEKRPNILLAIADDWSWPHAGAYGCKFVKTPAFDQVAREGVLFNRAFCASPGCSPSRAALLTGRQTWQIEQAGTHASSFPSKYLVYPDILEKAGYHVGFTGKGWAPGNWKASGRTRNPAGPEHSDLKLNPPYSGINKIDYAGNFKAFLSQRPKDKPFCFWYGGHEPHRAYEQGSGLKEGRRPEDAVVPLFLPDVLVVRSDELDYAVEVEWFDRHLGLMMRTLEEAGELDNTLIVVTSDNGMPFPRAKANVYEYGIHMPMAIRWPRRAKAGRTIDDFVSFIDLAPTFLEAAGLKTPATMTGRSIMNLLAADGQGQVDPTRARIFAGRERHSSARVNNLGYPSRALRTADFLYIRNFAPDRWPAGDPRGVEGDSFGYYDIDASPSKTFVIEKGSTQEYRQFFDLAVAKRPAEELYVLKDDPYAVVNVADRPERLAALKQMRSDLEQYLKKTGDPRILGTGDIFESYPRYSPIRKFQ